jgi:fatty-acid desaturase
VTINPLKLTMLRRNHGSIVALLAILVMLRTFWSSMLAFTAPAFKVVQRFGLSSGKLAVEDAHKPTIATPSLPSSLSTPATLLSVAVVAALARQSRKISARAAESDDAAVSTERDSRAARAKGAQRLPLGEKGQRLFSARNRQFWDYVVFPRTYFHRAWEGKDIGYGLFFTIIHLGAACAPFFFTWDAFMVFLIGYVITGMFGITLSYHRQLAHRSFTTPKWLEYLFAYCGVLALQSHPINWVSSHRHHHGGTETENDVHSPLDGFWWSHMGWLMDTKNTWMRKDKANASDLQGQWFYRFLAKTYAFHAIALPLAVLYALGGLPYVFWGFFARVIWVWHVTWAVNSVSHVWGFQDWNTGDKSMNNWLIGFLAFGEGWHNNHHAFETSCRHGLKWWQIDFTWYTVKFLSFLGLARNLKYPTESKMRRLSWSNAAAA